MKYFKLTVLLLLIWVSPAWAAISFVGSASSSAIDGGNVTITLPTTQPGDLVIVTAMIGTLSSDIDITMTTSNYNEIADLFCDDSRNGDFGVFWKIMPATPDTTAVFTGDANANSGISAVAMVFRGVDQTTPFDVTSTTATGIDTMHPNPPSIDHNNPTGVWVVIGGGSSHGNGTQSYTNPTGYTTNAVTVSADDTNDSAAGMGYKTAPSDPEDPGVMTLSGTDNAGFCWGAATMALRPAKGGLMINRTPVGDNESGRLVY